MSYSQTKHLHYEVLALTGEVDLPQLSTSTKATTRYFKKKGVLY